MSAFAVRIAVRGYEPDTQGHALTGMVFLVAGAVNLVLGRAQPKR